VSQERCSVEAGGRGSSCNQHCVTDRVATNLENLECLGISLNRENSRNVQRQGKIVTKKVFLVRHSNICVKQLVTCYIAGVDVERTLMKVIVTFTFCCDNLWNGSGKAWKTRTFFPTVWPP